MFYNIAFAAVSVVLVYAFLVRPVLKKAPVLSPVFAAEATFAQKFHAKMTGFKTKLTSRLLMIASFLIEFYDKTAPLIMGQDWTPVTHRLPDWSIPVGLFVIAYVMSWLREVTENPHQVITQRMDNGDMQVVAVNPPVGG